MSRALGRHTRPKKLTPKQTVNVFREEQVEIIEYDASRGVIETGVDKNEESEYHLQKALEASQAAAINASAAYIPTPQADASNADYGALYPSRFKQPATYIRSSSTVEDCAGTPYCMDEVDELALKQINGGLPDGHKPFSEDHFEDVMNFFEESALTKQPFAAVDNPPVLPLDELLELFDDTVPPHVKSDAKFVYEHWHTRRTITGNRGLAPHLKAESGKDTDDADPYVSFRRRELRQPRKTRNRDAQSAEKLRKLREDLEIARNLLAGVKDREILKSKILANDKALFQQRCEVKENKRKLGIKGDDEDLINQKPKKRFVDQSPAQQALSQQMRLANMRGYSEDLRMLDDYQVEKQKAIEREIQINVDKHIRWNEGFVDKTRAPLTPILDKSPDKSDDFRQAMPTSEYLPTPPASVSDEEGQQNLEMLDVDAAEESRSSTPFRYASPSENDSGQPMRSFRRRTGRGGRTMFDRKIPFRPKEISPSDHKFRFESDDEDDDTFAANDQDSFHTMQHRAYLYARSSNAEAAHAQALRRSQAETAAASSSTPTS